MEVTINVDGMSCGHCVKTVTQALETVDGIEVVDVVIGAATIRYDPQKTSLEAAAAAIDETGFESTLPGREL